MKKKFILTEAGLYLIFTLLALFSFTFDVSAQSVVKDAAGNYRQVSARNDSTGYKETGKTFTTNKGEIFPVMISNKGKLFVIRVSKATGKSYRQYLKL